MQVILCAEQESILIGDDVTVRVLEVCDDTVVFGIELSEDMSSFEPELVDAVQRHDEMVCRPR